MKQVIILLFLLLSASAFGQMKIKFQSPAAAFAEVTLLFTAAPTDTTQGVVLLRTGEVVMATVITHLIKCVHDNRGKEISLRDLLFITDQRYISESGNDITKDVLKIFSGYFSTSSQSQLTTFTPSPYIITPDNKLFKN